MDEAGAALAETEESLKMAELELKTKESQLTLLHHTVLELDPEFDNKIKASHEKLLGTLRTYHQNMEAKTQ